MARGPHIPCWALWARSGVGGEHLVWRAGNAEGVRGGALSLGPRHWSHPPPTEPGTAQTLWLGRQENCISWIKTWDKIALWKLSATSLQCFPGLSCNICVSSQSKCPRGHSSVLTDDFLEFSIRYVRRKKHFTRLTSEIINFSKLEIPLFV